MASVMHLKSENYHSDHSIVQTLALAYWATMESGTLGDRGAVHLRFLWRELDPALSLLKKVTEELNKMFKEERRKCLKGAHIGPLSFAWLGQHMLREFAVQEEDVEHMLHSLKPPPEQIVKLFGVDVGAVLAMLLPLGDGGTVRAQYQLVALRNRLRGAHAHGCTQEGDHHSEVAHIGSDFGAHLRRAGRLYVTAITARYVPMLLRSYTVFKLLGWQWKCILWLSRRGALPPVLITPRELPILLPMLAASDVPRVLHARMPMLQARLHRRLCEEGLLKAPRDFTHRVDLPFTTLVGSGLRSKRAATSDFDR